jgi:hypothetical protein
VAATYAVPASCGDASMMFTRVNGCSAGGVTFCQSRPPLRVSWTSPSSDPVQMTPFSFFDSAIVKIVE